MRKPTELFYQTCVIDASANAPARLVHDIAQYNWGELYLRMLKALLTARNCLGEVQFSRILSGKGGPFTTR